MSARQNKKRKGRNNVNNRERTVTTLTEDPNTPYLIPTPSEEPAGASLMSSSFSIATSSAPNQNTMPPAPPFQMPGNFGFGYGNVNYLPSMHSGLHHQQQHPQQPQPFFQQPSQPVLPPGQNDLEVLENLKKMIKDGQHEFYRAVPQPAALASIYLGSLPQSQVSHHPEQDLSEGHVPGQSANHTSGNIGSGAVSRSVVDSGRRPPRIQIKDNWDGHGPRKPPVGPPSVGPSSQIPNNVLSASSPDVSLSAADSLQFSQSNQGPHSQVSTHYNTNNKGPMSTGLKSESDSRRLSLDSKLPATVPASKSSEIPSPSQRSFRFDQATGGAVAHNSIRPHSPVNNQHPPSDRVVISDSAYGARTGPGESSSNKSSLFDVKEKVPSPSGASWQHRDGPSLLDERRARHDLDRPTIRPFSNVDGRSGATDMTNRGPGLRYPNYNDRERERDRDRDRNRDWDFRDRRLGHHFRDDRPGMGNRRPPPDQRHYEPRYGDFPPPRHYDGKPGTDEVPPTTRPLEPPRPVLPLTSVDDRGTLATVDGRPISGRPPLENRLGHVSSTDDRRGQPPGELAVQPPPINQVTVASEIANESANAGDRGSSGLHAVPPVSSIVVDDRRLRQPVSHEDRTTMPPPSLQDRLSQPPSVKTENSRPSREPNLEERLSHATTATTTDGGRPAPDDRSTRPTHTAPPGGPERSRTGAPGDDRSRLVDPTRQPPPQDARERAVHPEERSGRAGPGDRYVRPVTPVHDRGLPRPVGYGSQQIQSRSASVAREDTRSTVVKTPSPQPSDYQETRDISRERPDLRTGYRVEPDRAYPDDRERRTDAMDGDGPSRYTDSRVPYSRRFSPPSTGDMARDRARTWFNSMPSPPPRALPDTPPYDIDPERRYPPPPPPPLGDRREWTYSQPSYSERRRNWSQPDEDLYWKSQPRRTWERNGGASIAVDKERFEREGPPAPPSTMPSTRNNGWETREERERRTAFVGGLSPPVRSSFDGPPALPQRPISSRLPEGYPGPTSGPGPEERSYLPSHHQRELERSRYPSGPVPGPRDSTHPTFSSSRVRPRSPSPIGRRFVGGPGGDDMRPPVKRPREEPGYPIELYTPPPSPSGISKDMGRRLSISGEYMPRVTPPPASGSNYYDSRNGPPPSLSSGGGGGSGGLSGEREYGSRDRSGVGVEYGGSGPSSYERSRSPLPPSRLPPSVYGRGGYGRGGDPRDERRYNMPPHPSRNG